MDNFFLTLKCNKSWSHYRLHEPRLVLSVWWSLCLEYLNKKKENGFRETSLRWRRGEKQQVNLLPLWWVTAFVFCKHRTPTHSVRERTGEKKSFPSTSLSEDILLNTAAAVFPRLIFKIHKAVCCVTNDLHWDFFCVSGRINCPKFGIKTVDDESTCWLSES